MNKIQVYKEEQVWYENNCLRCTQCDYVKTTPKHQVLVERVERVGVGDVELREPVSSDVSCVGFQPREKKIRKENKMKVDIRPYRDWEAGQI